MQPHRGPVILVFGILGFLVCQVFAPIAWVMGWRDLKEIEAGRMDPTGKGLTQAGMILGIIGSILFILLIMAIAFALVIGLAAIGTQR